MDSISTVSTKFKGNEMLYITVLLKYWHYIVIALLFGCSYHFYDQYQDKKQELSTQVLIHKQTLTNLELQYKEELLVQQGKLLEANEKVSNVVSNYNAEIEAQNTKTKTVYKEVEKFIPVYNNPSCTYDEFWVSEINTYISSNGAPNNP